MARDDGPSKMRDLQQRLDVDGNYANQYRARLVTAEIVRSAGHGAVDFAMPYLREYLRSGHAPPGRRPSSSEEVARVFDEWGATRRPPVELDDDLDVD